MAGMLFQAHPCRERVWADLDMGAILTIKGLVPGAALLVTFLAGEKSDSRAYSVKATKLCQL